VILDEILQAVLHAAHVLGETLTEFLVDPLILLLDRPVSPHEKKKCFKCFRE
jgi:hypothetical protein